MHVDFANEVIAELLQDVKGTKLLSIDISTEPTLLGGKKNPMKGHVRKIQVGANVMVAGMKKGSVYDNMVRRRLAAEGKDPDAFELQERKWGKRVDGTPFIENKGELYLEVFYVKPGKVHYEHNGKQIDPAFIEGLPPAREEAEQGGLEDKVIIRTVKLENILAMNVNGGRHEF
jgi:hypothetical protein